MAVKIALGNDMDLVFIGFQLFPRLEGRNGSEQQSAKTGFHRNTREYVATILYQVSLHEAIANARLQLYAVAIKSFYIDVESYAILYCFTLGKPAGYEVGKNMAELYPWPGGHIIDESCIVCRQIRVVLDR